MKVFYRCKKCVMPNTKPDLFFDEEGVCDACRSAEARDAIDWRSREQQLTKILNKFRHRQKVSLVLYLQPTLDIRF